MQAGWPNPWRTRTHAICKPAANNIIQAETWAITFHLLSISQLDVLLSTVDAGAETAGVGLASVEPEDATIVMLVGAGVAVVD